MGSQFRQVQVLLTCMVLSWTAGCLSLGGKTTYVTEGSDNANRISALETRVGMLEQAVLNGQPPANMPTP